ncbi:Rieske (2Fe-2S) protein [Rhizosphaericola mali]|uniref:Rieske 2Fe-2S domain-containing protein n=1 Tax=Rhizosphaericola mali TaxID=2545455 RepID=A0A5P2G5A2_9BACT|nr:Rieske 2Fe-2S domain-containing protein [Rhizosphaericola mali]QES90377.1 Rieske 2Fe-2S domain-containing protein [Rhizosphaericola mali]
MKYMESELEWLKVSDSIFDENVIKNIKLNNNVISIVFNNNRLYAFQSKCPHSGAKFSEGFLDKNNCLVCPLHKFKFKLTNGLNVTGEGYRLKVYPTKLENSIWFVGIKKENQI